MGINARLFAYALEAAVRQTQLWGTSVKVALMQNTWTPDQVNDKKWVDVRAHEITGTNYVAGGMALTYPNPYYTYTPGATPGGTLNLKADNATFAALTTVSDIKYAVLYSADGTEETNPDYGGYGCPLIGWVSLAADTPVVATDFTLEWTDGIVTSISLETANPAAPYAHMQGTFWLKAFSGEVLFNDGNWKAALVKNTWAPSQDDPNFSYLSGIIPTAYTGNEIANTGNYARVAIANMTAYYNPPVSGYGGRYDFSGGNVIFSNLTSSADFAFAVIFYDTGVAATSPVLGFINLGGVQSAVNQNVTIAWDAGVIFQTSLSTAADV